MTYTIVEINDTEIVCEVTGLVVEPTKWFLDEYIRKDDMYCPITDEETFEVNDDGYDDLGHVYRRDGVLYVNRCGQNMTYTELTNEYRKDLLDRHPIGSKRVYKR